MHANWRFIACEPILVIENRQKVHLLLRLSIEMRGTFRFRKSAKMPTRPLLEQRCTRWSDYQDIRRLTFRRLRDDLQLSLSHDQKNHIEELHESHTQNHVHRKFEPSS